MPGPSRRAAAPSRSLDLALAQVGAGAAALAALEAVLLVEGPTGPTRVLLLFPACAAVYVAAGLVAWHRRPGSRMGPLVAAGGFAWFAAGLVNTGSPVLVAVGYVTSTVPLALVVHMLLAFPSGRVVGVVARSVVAAAYVVAVVLQVPAYLFLAAQPAPYDVLSVADRPDLAALGSDVQSAAGAAVVVATTAVLVVRLRRADAVRRRALTPLFAYGVVAVLWLPVSAVVLPTTTGLDPVTRAALQLGVLAGVPVAFVLGMLRGGFRRTAEFDQLSTWLGSRTGGDRTLRVALAEALGDPSVDVLFWVSERERFADADGFWVELPVAGSDRAWVEVQLAGRRVGAISYDATLVADPEVVRRAGRVVAIALDRDRLTAELLASREALRRSRTRIVSAGDSQRRALARDLHDGLQVQLVLLALAAYRLSAHPAAPTSVREDAAALRSGLDEAAGELRRLVQGVMPSPLIERGLYAAVEALVDRMPIPTTLDLTGTDDDLPDTVQSSAYFAVSEVLTNAVKHSHADSLAVAIHRSELDVTIDIRDDGVGGASPDDGRGLRGLADRLDALGGTVHIDSPEHRGTRLVVRVPCG